MGDGTAIVYGLLSASDPFQQLHSALEELVALHVDEVCAGKSMLGDENGFAATLDVAEQFSGLSLKSGNKFGTHRVIL
jgi:hypothetical protein